jgi:selenide, water dikinase
MNTVIASDSISSFRLTDLAHGGGCGCKLSPAVLRQLLSHVGPLYPQLLVGTETSDDAAVWRVDERTCIVATTDFFLPIVDDPRDFGRIAAANAISDIYAMGGKPVLALAILGMPLGKIPLEVVRAILEGGSSMCAEAGIPVAGGHSIDTAEPIYGLAVIGIATPETIRRNTDAKPGDALILTKALGVGVYSSAFKNRSLPVEAYSELLATTTLLNRVGHSLAQNPSVHAMTDVTGFGLLGHALEVARGSKVRVTIQQDRLPLLRHAPTFAQSGFITGASDRNWASYATEVQLPPGITDAKRALLTDPQTSGGLLVSCGPDQAEDILASIRSEGYPAAQLIGWISSGNPEVYVT